MLVVRRYPREFGLNKALLKAKEKLEKLCDSCAPENRDKVMAEIANMTDSAKKTYDEALSVAKESFEKAKKEALSEYEQSINDLNSINGSVPSIMENVTVHQ